jgi:aconitate decarboxylase
MNVMYTVAVAFLDGSVLIDQFAEDRINRDDVWNLIGRTRTHHEKAYDALPVEDRLTTRVVVTLKNGNTREKTVGHPPGTGDRRLTGGDIIHKYRGLAHSVIDADRQSAIEKVVLNLEALDDISTLIHLLTPKVRAVLG